MLSAQTVLDNDRTFINDIFDRLGLTPRLCIKFARDPERLATYEYDPGLAVSNIQANNLKKLFADAQSLTLNAISHELCLISRQDQKNLHSHPVVALITDSIKSRLAIQFRHMEQNEGIRLYHYFSRVPESRALAGVFFEVMAQR